MAQTDEPERKKIMVEIGEKSVSIKRDGGGPILDFTLSEYEDLKLGRYDKQQLLYK